MGNLFYSNFSSGWDPYKTKGKNLRGVDIRKVLHGILITDKEGENVIYRRAKIGIDGYPIKCVCTLGNRSNEADKDIPCEFCEGMGYYFQDIIAKTYVNNSQAYAEYKRVKKEGDSQVEYKTCYFEWDFLKRGIDDNDNIPNRFDRIIRLKQDLEGNIISPTQARETYEILSTEPYRLDNSGRIEYYRVRIISVVDKSFLV